MHSNLNRPMSADLIFLLLAVSGSSNLDDRDLAVRIRRGDLEAFESFFEAHKEMLFGFLRRRNVPPDEARDIIQNAFITIWERRSEIDENKSLRSYLYRISYTRALNHFRDYAKFDTDAEPEPDSHDHEYAEQQTDLAIMRKTLEQIVGSLPEKRRAVFELCFLQELTYREAAEVLEVSIKTVENHMGLALKAVRTGMERFR